MEFIGGRSHRMAAWTHIRERENEGRTEDGGVVSGFPNLQVKQNWKFWTKNLTK